MNQNKINLVILWAAYGWLPTYYLIVFVPPGRLTPFHGFSAGGAMIGITAYLLILFGFGWFIQRWRALLMHTAGIYLFLNGLRLFLEARHAPGFPGGCHDCTPEEESMVNVSMWVATFIALTVPIAVGVLSSVIYSWIKQRKAKPH